MKKTKMILAAALMIVAVGGAFASKAKVAQNVFYTNNGTDFIPYTTDLSCSTDGADCIDNVPGVGVRQLFRQDPVTLSFISLQHD
jgi:hypothetical protein